MEILALLTMVFGCTALLLLLVLHVVSPEFQPSWRMISEYALGKKPWILTSFFYSWGITSLLCAALLGNVVQGFWPMVGLVLVALSGVGAIMGGLFDVQHKLHGLAFGIGIPTLPTGALFIGYHLIALPGWNNYEQNILFASHALWISVVFMAVSMMLLFTGFKKAGIPMGPNIEPPKTLPKGVIAINGYFNRLLVICYVAWCIIVANAAISITN